MQELAEHLLRPILSAPDALALQTVESDNAIVVEAIVSSADRAMLEDDGERALRSIRTILSAAAGRQKATLELVDAFGEHAAEE